MEKINLDKYKGIIFDLDGVIFDIVGSIKRAVEDGVSKYKLTKVSIDDTLQEIAHLIEDLQNYPIPEILLNSYDLLKLKFMEGISFIKKLRIGVYLYNQFNKYKEDAKLFDGIEDIISKLSDKVKLAILTNNKNTYAEEVLEKFDLKEYFDVIIGFNEVEKVKPSPEGIFKILEKWNLKPSEALFIGDMTTDILAGKAAQVKTICLASGLAPKEALLANSPDILVENTKQLKEIFGF